MTNNCKTLSNANISAVFKKTRRWANRIYARVKDYNEKMLSINTSKANNSMQCYWPCRKIALIDKSMDYIPLLKTPVTFTVYKCPAKIVLNHYLFLCKWWYCFYNNAKTCWAFAFSRCYSSINGSRQNLWASCMQVIM